MNHNILNTWKLVIPKYALLPYCVIFHAKQFFYLIICAICVPQNMLYIRRISFSGKFKSWIKGKFKLHPAVLSLTTKIKQLIYLDPPRIVSEDINLFKLVMMHFQAFEKQVRIITAYLRIIMYVHTYC